MRYVQPFDQPSNPTAPYVDLNEAMGVDGSVPPAKLFNNLQAEILNVITGAGLTPNDGDLTQLFQAIIALMPSPSGGPSDASLVHYATDSGGVNNLIVTPSPVAAGLAAGFTIFVVPANTVTGNALITVNLSLSGSIVKNIRRDDLSDLRPGDIKAARLCCLVYDGTQFRLAWVYRGVVTDGVTIFGAGVESDPLIAARSGFGVEIGQSVHLVVHIAGSYANPAQAGFAMGQIYPAAALTTGAFGAGINGNLIGVFPVNALANTGSAAPWPAPASAVEGNLVGNWRLVGWQVTSGVIGITAYTLVFRRVN